MRILYVGPKSGTILLRGKAAERLGHEVTYFEPQRYLPKSRLTALWLYRAGGIGFDSIVARAISAELSGNWDVVWVDPGDLVGIQSVKRLNKLATRSVLFNYDNPFVKRDRLRWENLKKALPYYDLFVTPRLSTEASAYRHRAKKTLCLFMAADEKLHSKLDISSKELEYYNSEVSFIGTWMKGRDEFVKKLVELAVPIRVFGTRWHKSPYYRKISHVVTNKDLVGTEYVKAIQSSKICIGLLSVENKDLHTTRSIEIPAIGTLLCAERTKDHEALYVDGAEAVFFSSAEECAAICHRLLGDPAKLAAIAGAGHVRALENGHFYEKTVAKVLSVLCG